MRIEYVGSFCLLVCAWVLYLIINIACLFVNVHPWFCNSDECLF